MMRGGRGRGGGRGARPPPPVDPHNDAEEGEVLSLSPPPEEAPLSSYASLASAVPLSSSMRSSRPSNSFRGGGGGGRHRMNRGGRERFGNSNDTHRFPEDSGSVASGEDGGHYSRAGRGGRNRGSDRGRGGRGGRGRGRSYMANQGRGGRGPSHRGNDWNNDAGSVSSFEAVTGGGRPRAGRGGRQHGRGRGRGQQRFDSSSSRPMGKRRSEDRSLHENAEILTKRLRETAPSFGSEGEILPDEEAAYEQQRRFSGSDSPSTRRLDHPGLDRPLSEGRRGNWEDRSLSHDGSVGKDSSFNDKVAESLHPRDSVRSASPRPDNYYRPQERNPDDGPAVPEQPYTNQQARGESQSSDYRDLREESNYSALDRRGVSSDGFDGGSSQQMPRQRYELSQPTQSDQSYAALSDYSLLDRGAPDSLGTRTGTRPGRFDAHNDRKQVSSYSPFPPRDFGMKPPGRSFSNDKRETRPPASGNAVLQSGYAALANLPGPVGPPKPPPTGQQTVSGAPAVSSTSYASGFPQSQRDFVPRVDMDLSRPIDNFPQRETFTRAPPGTAPRFENHDVRPYSPKISDDFDRRGGFDGGPRSQNFGGPGRGRGRFAGRGGDFPPMGRGGPRSFEPMKQGRGREGPGDRLGDMPAYHDREGRGSIPTDIQVVSDGHMPRDFNTVVPGDRGPAYPSSTSSFVAGDARPGEFMPVDDRMIHTGDQRDGGGHSSFDSFRGGRGRGAFGRSAGRGRQRDFGRGRGWDQGGRAPQPWDQRGESSSLPRPPQPTTSTTLTNTFAMLADANPTDLFRRRSSGETGGLKPPPLHSLAPPYGPQPSPQEGFVDTFPAEADNIKEEKAKSPSPPPRPATPPPSEPSGLVVAMTRLASMEEELNFAYARHMKLIAEQTKMRASYARLQDLPVGLEALEDELKAYMASRDSTETGAE